MTIGIAFDVEKHLREHTGATPELVKPRQGKAQSRLRTAKDRAG